MPKPTPAGDARMPLGRVFVRAFVVSLAVMEVIALILIHTNGGQPPVGAIIVSMFISYPWFFLIMLVMPGGNWGVYLGMAPSIALNMALYFTLLVPPWRFLKQGLRRAAYGPPVIGSIREMRLTDVEETFSLRARTRQNPLSKRQLATRGITPESIAALMAGGQVKGWACFDNGALAGFCLADSAGGEVLVLAVLPDYEGKGIGARLLSHAVEWLRLCSATRPWLAASADPAIRAHGFYRALGWKPTGKRLNNGDEILRL